jgi:hypothetical protein
MMAAERLVGLAFGRLLVVGTVRRRRQVLCLCACACGRVAMAEPQALMAGRRVSCGCAMGGDRRSADFRKSTLAR